MRTFWTLMAVSVVAVSAVMALPALAQRTPEPTSTPAPPCGDLSPLPDDADAYLSVFSSPDQQWLRNANGFETLSPASEVVLLTDERACADVLESLRARVRDLLPDTPEGRAARRDGYRYLIYRVGPYYVVPLHPLDEEGGFEESRAFVQVFRVEDLTFVGDFVH